MLLKIVNTQECTFFYFSYDLFLHFSESNIGWQTEKRQLMLEKGLYKKHSRNHKLLRDFATYLHEDLKVENYRQDVRRISKSCSGCLLTCVCMHLFIIRILNRFRIPLNSISFSGGQCSKVPLLHGP